MIERPASVVRELMENAVDSGATSIEVNIEAGGIESIRVVDDGAGIPPEDLDVIAQPHATSKIVCEDDLLAVSTLGFRGEALSSIAAVADLEILSSQDGLGARKYFSRPHRQASLESQPGRKGTSVAVFRLFESYPARKRFLKRAATETSLVQQIFIDRALAHNHIEFRLTVDGKPKIFLPRSSMKARVLSAYGCEEPESFFHEAQGKNIEFAYTLVFGNPEIHRPDRRHIQCFVNGRRVQDFSLQKSLEIAYSGFLPGGIYPFAFVFLQLDPAKIDFNIHPAKKEVRFRDTAALQSALIKCVKEALTRSCSAPIAKPARLDDSSFPNGADTDRREMDFDFGKGQGKASNGGSFYPSQSWSPRAQAGEKIDIEGFRALADFRAVAESRPSLNPASAEDEPFRLIGQTLGVFIIVERNDEVLLIDQHAAHERILFDALESRPIRRQELLVPYVFEPESQADGDFLKERSQELSLAGFDFQETEGGSWSLISHPEGLKAKLAHVVREILELRDSGQGMRRALNALTACRSAIKEGELLDNVSAQELARQALALPDQHCPHGRPILVRLGRDELYRRCLRLID